MARKERAKFWELDDPKSEVIESIVTSKKSQGLILNCDTYYAFVFPDSKLYQELGHLMKQFLQGESYGLEVQTGSAYKNGFTVGIQTVKGKPVKVDWYKTKSGFSTKKPVTESNGIEGMNLGNLPITLSLPTGDDDSDPWSEIF